MADGIPAPDSLETLLIKDLVYESKPGMPEKVLPVGGHNARGLLPAVLEGVQAKVRELDRFLISPHPEETTIMSNRRVVHEVQRQPAMESMSWNATN